MQKVFVMYKLKPGVTLDQYTSWSVALDQKVTPFQEGVIRYEAYGIKGAYEGDAPYQIVEDIEVDDWDTWMKVVGSPAMKEVMDTWGEYADASTMVMVYGDKVK